MTSVATNRLNLQSLPQAARKCHKFNHMSTPLLLVKTFFDNNADVLFKRDRVTVTNEEGNTVLEGALDPTTDLYMVPLDDPPNTVPPQGGGTIKPRAMTTTEVNNTSGKAFSTKTIADQVNMHHLTLGSPTQATFIQAVEKGWLTEFPNLTVENAKLFFTKKAKTILGHQKLI